MEACELANLSVRRTGRKVLKGCDRATALGRRDYAILVMLAKLGMRAGEVATLTLDDIDWRSGELLICAKGRQRARMPISPDVDAPVVAYLRDGRPRSSCRRLFLRTMAPKVGFASGCAITMIAKAALDRAGIRGYAHQGAHIIRHSLATEPLRSGATLSEIGQLLRHETHDTARIYAKVAPEIKPTVAGRRAMTDLRTALERYLSMRRGLGYKYQHQEATAGRFLLLNGDPRGCDHHDEAGQNLGNLTDRHASWAFAVDRRAGLRAPCREHRAEDGVPPVGILPGLKRAKHYVYSDAEINALLAAALALRPE